ncbi:Uncharacterised protein [Candidatus Tiddalikarchaeum anstoanum]|nr:Uncharacterised protein [Candidatus Tiddalikarchaeum anstoanum]
MTNRKTQIFAVREVLQFAMGVLLLISVIVLFNSIKPIVENFSLQKQADNVNSHVNYILSSVEDAGELITEGSIESEYDLPEKIGGYEYRIYFNESSVCTLIRGVKDISTCLDYTITQSSVDGFFTSGGKLQILLNKTLDNSAIYLSN